MPIEKFDLVLESYKDITPSIRHFCFSRDDGMPFNFIPGQFITFLFDHEDGIKRRSYSVATIPTETDLIEIAVSYVEGGIATYNLFNMKVGDQFHAMGPAGRLIMQKDDAKRYVLVGTGTGIAPYRAMLPALGERMQNEDFKVLMLLGAQYRKDLLYLDDFVNFAKTNPNFTFRAQLSRDELNDQKAYEHKGYVQSAFDEIDLDPTEDIVFLCGNPNMIDQAFEDCQMRSFDSKSVKREKYISSN